MVVRLNRSWQLAQRRLWCMLHIIIQTSTDKMTSLIINNKKIYIYTMQYQISDKHRVRAFVQSVSTLSTFSEYITLILDESSVSNEGPLIFIRCASHVITSPTRQTINLTSTMSTSPIFCHPRLSSKERLQVFSFSVSVNIFFKLCN